MWEVWFLGQIVCYNIEHPSIINKINFIKKIEVHLSISKVLVSFLAQYKIPVMKITNFGFGLMTTTSNARLILTRFWTSTDKITMIEIGDKSPSTIPNMETKINNGQLMLAKSNPTGAT